jgi:hypothetical protein
MDIRPLSPFGISGSYFQHNSESYKVENTDLPWVFASGMSSVSHCELPLIEKGQAPARYNVRLYFAATDSDKPDQRVFDIRLQNETVSENVDVLKQAGGPLKALTLEFNDVLVTENLAIDLMPVGRPRSSNMPPICGIEVTRVGSEAILQKVAGK